MTHRTGSRALAVILSVTPVAGLWIACSRVAEPQPEQTIESDQNFVVAEPQQEQTPETDSTFLMGYADPDDVPRGSMAMEITGS